MNAVPRRTVLTGAVALAAALAVPVPAAADTTPRVFLIGDSMSLRLADDIMAHLPARVIGRGVGGTPLAVTLRIGREILDQPDYAGDDIVLWGAHRDVKTGAAPASLAREIGGFDAEVRAAGGRLIVLSLTNRPDDAQRGTPLYERIIALNGLLAAQQGAEYLDVRSWLVSDGLRYRRIAPTPQDRADIAVDVPPDSLRADEGNPGHLNDEEGKPAAGYRIAQHLRALPPPS